MSVFNEKHLRQYIATAIERENVWLRREQGEPKPWTTNKVLHKYRFCNVFRQNDKCTVWMYDNLIANNSGKVAKLMENIITFRYISSYHIYEELARRLDMDKLCTEHVVYHMREMKKEGNLKYNGCFLRNPHANGSTYSIVDIPMLMVRWLREHNAEFLCAYYEGTFEALTKFFMDMPATSGFMAHQYCCDLEYSDLWNPTDKYTYATMGPGSKQGMNLVLGRARKAPLNQRTWIEYARALRLELNKAFIDYFEGPWDEDVISMQDVQNWLCEYQKYVKYDAYENGGPKVKVRYYN